MSVACVFHRNSVNSEDADKPRGADAHGDRDAGVLGVYVRMFGINESDGML